jgi:hypothetical protein
VLGVLNSTFASAVIRYPRFVSPRALVTAQITTGSSMTNSRPSAWLVAAVVVVCGVVVASAADRVRAGQWETTMTISGQVL